MNRRRSDKAASHRERQRPPSSAGQPSTGAKPVVAAGRAQPPRREASATPPATADTVAGAAGCRRSGGSGGNGGEKGGAPAEIRDVNAGGRRSASAAAAVEPTTAVASAGSSSSAVPPTGAGSQQQSASRRASLPYRNVMDLAKALCKTCRQRRASYAAGVIMALPGILQTFQPDDPSSETPGQSVENTSACRAGGQASHGSAEGTTSASAASSSSTVYDQHYECQYQHRHHQQQQRQQQQLNRQSTQSSPSSACAASSTEMAGNSHSDPHSLSTTGHKSACGTSCEEDTGSLRRAADARSLSSRGVASVFPTTAAATAGTGCVQRHWPQRIQQCKHQLSQTHSQQRDTSPNFAAGEAGALSCGLGGAAPSSVGGVSSSGKYRKHSKRRRIPARSVSVAASPAATGAAVLPIRPATAAGVVAERQLGGSGGGGHVVEYTCIECGAHSRRQADGDVAAATVAPAGEADGNGTGLSGARSRSAVAADDRCGCGCDVGGHPIGSSGRTRSNEDDGHALTPCRAPASSAPAPPPRPLAATPASLSASSVISPQASRSPGAATAAAAASPRSLQEVCRPSLHSCNLSSTSLAAAAAAADAAAAAAGVRALCSFAACDPISRSVSMTSVTSCVPPASSAGSAPQGPQAGGGVPLHHVTQSQQHSRQERQQQQKQQQESAAAGPSCGPIAQQQQQQLSQRATIGSVVEREGLIALTRDVRNFKEALARLRQVFLTEKEKSTSTGLLVAAHERLGDVLRTLRGILQTYPPLQNSELLQGATTLIQSVRRFAYEDYEPIAVDTTTHEASASGSGGSATAGAFKRRNSVVAAVVGDDSISPQAIYDAVDQLALAFSTRVSEYLMGDLDTNAGKSRSCENLVSPDSDQPRGYESVTLTAEDVDARLMRLNEGVECALRRAKVWSKYAKDVMTYVEKRAQLEAEHARNLLKLAQTMRPLLKEESFLPFQSIYCTAIDQDLDNANNCLSNCTLLHDHKFVEPLAAGRSEHDKRRKQIKEVWHRELKKLQEADSNVRKCRLAYVQRQHEFERARDQRTADEAAASAAAAASLAASGNVASGSESAASKGSEKRRRAEEDLLVKARDAESAYRASVAEANDAVVNLDRTKADVLRQVRELIAQCDQTMKAVTVAYFQLQHSVTAPAPVQFQTLCESSRLYEPGSQYTEFVKRIPMAAKVGDRPVPLYSFEPYRNETEMGSDENIAVGAAGARSAALHERRLSTDEKIKRALWPSSHCDSRPSHAGVVMQQQTPLQSQQQGGRPSNAYQSMTTSDSDSAASSGKSRDASPTSSPQAATGAGATTQLTAAGAAVGGRQPQLQQQKSSRRRPAAAVLGQHASSGDELEVETAEAPAGGTAVGRKVCLSRAAETHAFRKLKTPSRCRECDSYVYFQGVECIECGLCSHKKCLETLAIQCGHKRLPRRMTTFGVDLVDQTQFSVVAPDDGAAGSAACGGGGDVPFIVRMCVDENDKRGCHIQGIYRVSATKSKVEKLCQCFENGAELVDLSDYHPNVIANVLKLYLRQLPEPLLTYNLYPEFIAIAKEFPANREDSAAAIGILRKTAKNLPRVHYATLTCLLKHLRRIAAVSEANNMPASNLGIVFGPTLLRMRDGSTSLSNLVDTVHQTRVIELLINYVDEIFDTDMRDKSVSDLLDAHKLSVDVSSVPRSKSGSFRRKSDRSGSKRVASKPSSKDDSRLDLIRKGNQLKEGSSLQSATSATNITMADSTENNAVQKDQTMLRSSSHDVTAPDNSGLRGLSGSSSGDSTLSRPSPVFRAYQARQTNSSGNNLKETQRSTSTYLTAASIATSTITVPIATATGAANGVKDNRPLNKNLIGTGTINPKSTEKNLHATMSLPSEVAASTREDTCRTASGSTFSAATIRDEGYTNINEGTNSETENLLAVSKEPPTKTASMAELRRQFFETPAVSLDTSLLTSSMVYDNVLSSEKKLTGGAAKKRLHSASVFSEDPGSTRVCQDWLAESTSPQSRPCAHQWPCQQTMRWHLLEHSGLCGTSIRTADFDEGTDLDQPDDLSSAVPIATTASRSDQACNDSQSLSQKADCSAVEVSCLTDCGNCSNCRTNRSAGTTQKPVSNRTLKDLQVTSSGNDQLDLSSSLRPHVVLKESPSLRKRWFSADAGGDTSGSAYTDSMDLAALHSDSSLNRDMKANAGTEDNTPASLAPPTQAAGGAGRSRSLQEYNTAAGPDTDLRQPRFV